MDDPFQTFAGRRGKFLSEFHAARAEHMWLLRAEGLTLQEIGNRVGLSKERTRQTIWKFGRAVRRATRNGWVKIIAETSKTRSPSDIPSKAES